jgi:signal transduction histidine kinase
VRRSAYARSVNEEPVERARVLSPVLAGAGLVSAAMLATVAIHPYDPFGGRQLVDGFTLATFLAAGWLALARHRSSGDPHALLVGVGFLILAAQTALFAGYATAVGRPATPAWEGRPFPSLAWTWAWALAALSFLLAVPWWERRGRPPIRPAAVAATAAGALLGGDLLLAVARKGFGTVNESQLRTDGPFAHATWLHWVLSAFAVGLLLAAARRERRTAHDRTSVHHWLTAAWLPACAAIALYLAWPVEFRPLLIPGAVLPSLTAAIVFAAFVSSGGAEASRMRRATDRADRITGGRAEIASMIAHELRGPVTTVKGLATTGARHYDSLGDPEKQEFFELIDQESRRLLHIVDETSAALKIDAGTITYDIRPENLEIVLADALRKADVGEHDVQVEGDPEIRIPLDRLRLSETLTQLLENAAHFSPAEQPIVVRSRRDGASVLIEVVDRGPGIASEHRERAFEKFAHFRPAGYEEVPGTGLGLFICRSHVLAHGGAISVVDPPEGGTMLRISLPTEGNG